MKLDHIISGPIENNIYLIIDESTNESVLIDAGEVPQDVISFVKDSGTTLKEVWITHGHHDHAANAQILKDEFNCKIVIHKNDAERLEGTNQNRPFPQSKADIQLEGTETLQIGSIPFKVIHVPGHTQGTCSFYNEKEKVLFTGDILFKNAVGRWDLYGGDREQLLTGIASKLFSLPGDTKVYPGHGPFTTIAEELENQPFIMGDYQKLR